MLVLVINCGSSSIKADLVESSTGARHGRLRVQRIGTEQATATLGQDTRSVGPEPAAELLTALLPELLATAPEPIGAVGHRVVHGGQRFIAPTAIDDEVQAQIAELSTLAPLHNPANVAGMTAARAICPDVPHVAVFDTAFHATLPNRARHYALPTAVAQAHGVVRYGFHGTSHQFVCARAAEFLGEPTEQLRIISCHLGNGASVAAVEYGRSVETSMGMTPLEGLVMGTRSGDVDAGALLHLMRAEGLDADGLDTLLNRKSGLAGLSGVGADMRDIEARAGDGDEPCRLAMQVFAHRLRKYIGAYAAVMGGVDAIVFTGGIGQGSAQIRHMACQRLDYLGARLDEDRNRDAVVTREAPVCEISEHRGRTRLLVVATDEQRAIATKAAAVAQKTHRVETVRTIPVAVSARHIHLTQPMVERLFGPGHTLTPKKPLSQPGQFACEEQLTLIGPKRSIEGVRVLGPVRRRNQVEISRTDEFWLGVDAPVRNSGDVSNSPGITLEGPAGRVTLREGLICAARHIHMTPPDAEAFGVENGDIVEVAIDSNGRDLVFGDVLIRVSPKFATEMHVDTDEANAAELSRDAEGLLVKSSGLARLRRLQRPAGY